MIEFVVLRVREERLAVRKSATCQMVLGAFVRMTMSSR
jgi:hypothetical protein